MTVLCFCSYILTCGYIMDPYVTKRKAASETLGGERFWL